MNRSLVRRALRWRAAIAHLLTALAERCDSYPWLCLSVVLAVVIPITLGHSLQSPLWHDELFTYHIAQEPTLAGLLHAIRLIDLVPPLSFLLTRASYAAFGINTLTTRLPEMAGFLLAMVSLFAFVRRRAGALFGLAAAALFFTGGAGNLAYEARPYGLLLGFGALGLLAWQRAREHRRFAIPLLVLSASGMLLDHVFSVYIWTALAAGEGLRIIYRRRIEWPLVLAWTIPLVCVITWIPLLRNHSHGIYPPQFQPGLYTIPIFYSDWSRENVVAVLCSAGALLLLTGRRALRGSDTWLLTRPEWLATLIILAVPAIVIFQLMRTHAAFFVRYGVPASLGIAILGAILLAYWTRSDSRAALACVLFALVLSKDTRNGLHAARHEHIFTRTEPTLDPCAPCAFAARQNLPLVDASGLTFVEMSQREPNQTLARVFYLTDPIASAEYAHANIFEGMAPEQQILHLRGNVSSYTAFTQQHRHFLVLGGFTYPEDWLLEKLLADGATVRLLGNSASTYTSRELYDITLRP